jgi:hypothetical protein
VFAISEIHKMYCVQISQHTDSSIVPLVVVFTKFDGQIIKEYTDLNYMETTDKWEKAKENAENAFQTVYIPKVMGTQYPPKACVKLEGRKWQPFLA